MEHITGEKSNKQQNKTLMFEDPFPLDYLHQCYRPTTQKIQEKIEEFIKELSKPLINIDKLKRLCFNGIPDDCNGLRSICWKILLGYLPCDKSKWKDIILESEKNYLEFCEMFLNKQYQIPEQSKIREMQSEYEKYDIKLKKLQKDFNQPRKNATQEDIKTAKLEYQKFQEISKNKQFYQYKEFFQDSALYEEVEKDTNRTRSEMHFFVTDTSDIHAKINSERMLEEDRKQKELKNQQKEINLLDIEYKSEEENKNQQIEKNEENEQKQQQQGQNIENIQNKDEEQNESQTQNETQNSDNNKINIENKQIQQLMKQVDDFKMDNQKYKILFSTTIQDERKQKNMVSEKHFDVLSRILYIYAKINPGIRYVQGMNEIIAPIYYVFKNDKTNEFFQKTVESDCFQCFTFLMGKGVKDAFIKQLDDYDTGIKTKVKELDEFLQTIDPKLQSHLSDMGINPLYYSLRWIMLILTQEFEIFDVLRIWDSYLAVTDNNLYLYCLCVSILQLMRDKIMSDEFSVIMETIQNVSQYKLDIILNKGSDLYKKVYNQRLKEKNKEKSKEKGQNTEKSDKNAINGIKKGLSGFFNNLQKKF